MSWDFITDHSGKSIAIIRDREIFRDETEEAKIAIVLNGTVYDLAGNLVGRLQGKRIIETSPGSFSKLLACSFCPPDPPLGSSASKSKTLTEARAPQAQKWR